MQRELYILIFAVFCLAALGCGQQAGVIFPPTTQPIVWPEGGTERPRIRYVGEIRTDQDLKPGRSGLQAIEHALFGKRDIHAMLTPFAVCTDEANRVFVADSNAQLVHVFDLQSRQYAQWMPGEKQPQLSQPVGIAWDPAGRLLVSDSVAGVVFVFNAQGVYQGQLGSGLLRRPCGLAVHPQTRDIYIADSAAHQVVVLAPSGELRERIGQRGTNPGEFNFPIALVIDRHGRLYVADALNFRVQQIGPDGKAIRAIGARGDMPGYFAQPKCVAVDSEDHLYVVDIQFEAIQIFTPEGALLLNFGEEGRGPGQFWLPTGMYIDKRNRIWVADSYNRRLQVFDYLAETDASATTLPGAKP